MTTRYPEVTAAMAAGHEPDAYDPAGDPPEDQLPTCQRCHVRPATQSVAFRLRLGPKVTTTAAPNLCDPCADAVRGVVAKSDPTAVPVVKRPAWLDHLKARDNTGAILRGGGHGRD